jgi:hypothetical protein
VAAREGLLLELGAGLAVDIEPGQLQDFAGIREVGTVSAIRGVVDHADDRSGARQLEGCLHLGDRVEPWALVQLLRRECLSWVVRGAWKGEAGEEAVRHDRQGDIEDCDLPYQRPGRGRRAGSCDASGNDWMAPS